jgi:hypothetical protein
MRALVPALLYLLSNTALAGGDFVLGKVAAFSGESGNYSFRFIQTDRNKELLSGCREFNVTVRYERVPWFSWLPFVHSSHPSKQKTEAAASFLRGASQSGQEVYFGYMGYGLVPTGNSCSFTSRGLALEQEHGKQYVLSYHDQT